MKTEMQMLPNGNYEAVVLPIQHKCQSSDYLWECVQYSHDMTKLTLKIESGDPYEDGFSAEIYVNYCPFCGYEANKTLRI